MKDLKTECSETLKALEKNVTANDKAEVTSENGISWNTQKKYLSGDVAKIDMAMTLIKLYSAKINRRIKDLDKAAA